ncbi:hypothetical protein ACVWXM_006984 [Bradyrhizobium sp. GM7.3]
MTIVGGQVSSKPSAAPEADSDFVNFDGRIRARGQLQQPDRYRYWRTDLTETPRISRGSGLSYAAASFLQDGLSVSHRSFDRVTDFDSAHHVVEVETGISLFALHRFLSSRGLYLPIQPGHGRISVGGCIAADVHGKNQSHDGTFINQVESIDLLHPSHGILELSPQKNPDLFRLDLWRVRSDRTHHPRTAARLTSADGLGPDARRAVRRCRRRVRAPAARHPRHRFRLYVARHGIIKSRVRKRLSISRRVRQGRRIDGIGCGTASAIIREPRPLAGSPDECDLIACPQSGVSAPTKKDTAGTGRLLAGCAVSGSQDAVVLSAVRRRRFSRVSGDPA